MVAIIEFLFFIIRSVLGLFVIALVVNAVLSWLFAFDVINHRNRFVNQLAATLDRIVSPVLAPLRSIIPPLGGMDVTPISQAALAERIRSEAARYKTIIEQTGVKLN